MLQLLGYMGQVIVIASKAILRYTYQQQIQHEDLKCLEDRHYHLTHNTRYVGL